MADQNLTQLTATTTPADADLVYTVVDPGGTPLDRKITWTSIKAFMKTYWDTIYAPIASPTFTGTVTLPTTVIGENSVQLDAALSADGKWSGITEPGTAGAALAFGDLCYFQAADSRWELADANLSAGYDKKLGMCVLSAAGDASATEMLLIGKIRADANFPALTIGAPVYMAETAGDIVVTQPTTADVAIRVIGYANTADELHFNPSNDYIVHV